MYTRHTPYGAFWLLVYPKHLCGRKWVIRGNQSKDVKIKYTNYCPNSCCARRQGGLPVTEMFADVLWDFKDKLLITFEKATTTVSFISVRSTVSQPASHHWGSPPKSQLPAWSQPARQLSTSQPPKSPSASLEKGWERKMTMYLSNTAQKPSYHVCLAYMLSKYTVHNHMWVYITTIVIHFLQ